MPLHIGGTGASRPHVKFNGKSGRWSVRTESDEREIEPPVFIADLANIVTGWIRFREGQAPERVIDPALDRAAPSPAADFRRGFVLNCYSRQYFGGLVELSGNSILLANAVRDAYAAFEQQRAANPGRVPVLRCAQIEPVRGKHGTNYGARFELVKWVDRPAEVPDRSPVEPHEVWQGEAPAKQQATHVQPPQPKAATPPASTAALADPLMTAEF